MLTRVLPHGHHVVNHTRLLLATAAATLVLSGCGASASKYQPIVDGPKGAGYEQDLSACSQVAEQREYLNDDVKSEAMMAAGVGGVLGGIDQGLEGAIGGALVGGAIGAGGKAWQVRDDRKKIVIECMKQRGHKVVG